MAEATFREFSQHCSRVAVAVAALALRYHLVLCLMASNAGKFAMFKLAGRKKVKCLFVAGCTIFRRGFVAIGYVLRHMGLMTFFTIGNCLISSMRFMALRAIRNLTVFVMAEATVKSSMFTLVVTKFDNLAGMAGQASIGNVIAECNIKWSMRI